MPLVTEAHDVDYYKGKELTTISNQDEKNQHTRDADVVAEDEAAASCDYTSEQHIPCRTACVGLAGMA